MIVTWDEKAGPNKRDTNFGVSQVGTIKLFCLGKRFSKRLLGLGRGG